MGLPKNFNEKVNRPKIVESLNDLNFYIYISSILYNKKLFIYLNIYCLFIIKLNNI